ncbi:MAG TPA: hypothetical protein PK878_10930 [bacterium]|nr:hypothetical protein [Candidatus Omnitrophota bacterium]HOJ60790.1 hypothetical protein [bacterium]HOL94325.1 hypothetical protein [bacterium]HPP00149.1 hypothetical protein [bacterium]HXK95717.1 hypothetical protein [bacterium]
MKGKKQVLQNTTGMMIDERVLFYLFLAVFSLWFVGNILEINFFQVLFDGFLHTMENIGEILKQIVNGIIDRFFRR